MRHVSGPRRELAVGWIIASVIAGACGDDEARREASAEADARARVTHVEQVQCETDVEVLLSELALAEDLAARAENEVELDRDLVARMEPGPLRDRQEVSLRANLARLGEQTERAESLRSRISAREADCVRIRQAHEIAQRDLERLSATD